MHRRVTTHALGALMLTDRRPMPMPMPLQGQRIDETVNAATEELVRYCLLKLGVIQAADVAGVLDALDLAAHNTLPTRLPSGAPAT